ncbi:MAG: ferritin [Calditrichaeota bacterium]|nr:MAG: ferritin [Calditrichota bacterium]
MLPEKINQALNEQIAKEAYASAYYLAMASWCEQNGFVGTANFFYRQSDEEREHMMKIFKYVNEAEGKAISPGIEQPEHEFDSYTSLFEKALEHERKVTDSIHQITALATDLKDYRTLNLLRWFVDEQLEEENQMQIILDKLKLIKDDGVGLYMLDSELGQRSETTEANE